MTDPAIRQETCYISHYGVYGVAIKGKGDERYILLIRKQLGCYTGLLDLPGGTHEPHELLEETGCTVESMEPPRAVSILYPFTSTKDGLDYTLRHLGALFPMVVRGEPHTTLNDIDSAGADWYAIDKLLDYKITPFVKLALTYEQGEKQ